MTAFARQQWVRRSLAGLAVLVALTPVFAWAAGVVGYAEPLDNAAELTGATAEAVTLHPGVLPGYLVPGLDPHLGTLVSGFVGTALTLCAAMAVGRLLQA